MSVTLQPPVENGKSPKTPLGKKLVQGRLPFAIVDNKSPALKKNAPIKSAGELSKSEECLKVEEAEEELSKAKQTAKVKDAEEVKQPEQLEDPLKVEPVEEMENMEEDATRKSYCSEPEDSDGDIVMLEEGEDEDDSSTNRREAEESFSSVGDRSIEGSAKKKTPLAKRGRKKNAETRQKREEQERRRAEERAELERRRAEEKAEKERQKQEKELEKKRKEKEKEAERRKKEEEKEAERNKKEEERKKKEDDKKKKEEEKEAEKREKEAEKRKKEDEEKRKKERISQAFTSFFTQRKSLSKTESDEASAGCSAVTAPESLAFPPFQVKENMRLAPLTRSVLDEERRRTLDQCLKQPIPARNRLFLATLGGCRGSRCGPTWPITKDSEVEIIADEDDALLTKEDDVIVGKDALASNRMRPKLLLFSENRRPAYWGTWRKTSHAVAPRRPFAKEAIFDYEVDSDDEWEEEAEPGESLTDSEGEDKEPADDYEVDNEFLVPHGYLSDSEGEVEDEDGGTKADKRPLSPSAVKEKLKLKEEQFERELKEKTCHVKPSLIGCCWAQDLEQNQVIAKVLNRYAAVLLTAAPIQLASDYDYDESTSPGGVGAAPEEGSARADKVNKRLVSEADVPVLIRIVHGSFCSKLTIVKEFQNHLERNRTDERNGSVPSKLQIVAKIGEIGTWSKCTEAGPTYGRTCWIVSAEVLRKYQLDDLAAVNCWEFSTETKKRGRKSETTPADLKNASARPPDEEASTPPSKTARVSLMTKFIQPMSAAAPPPAHAAPVTPADKKHTPDHNPDPSTINKGAGDVVNIDDDGGSDDKRTGAQSAPPKGKKRVALISLSASTSKRPRADLKATPLTSFLRRMQAKSEEASQDPTNNKDAGVDNDDCVVLE